jgi:hypothetical protein
VKRFTIIAEPPPETYGPLRGDNGFVANACEVLKNLGPARAASVVDVVSLIAEHEGPLSVQLVGHASAGQFFLGMAFMADQTKGRAWPYFVLDTTPSTLGFFAKHRGRIRELTLIGCGIADESSTWPVNGRSLLYCLSEVLYCSVFGARETVSPRAFDSDGRYTGALAGWQWHSPGPPSWLEDAQNVALNK